MVTWQDREAFPAAMPAHSKCWVMLRDDNVHALSTLWIQACSKHVLLCKRDKRYHWRKACYVCREKKVNELFEQSNNMLWLWALVRQIKYHLDFLLGAAEGLSPTGPSSGWWEHVVGAQSTAGQQSVLVLDYLYFLKENKYILYAFFFCNYASD